MCTCRVVGNGMEDYVTALEGVRVVMEEGKAMGAKDFFFTGGDHNIDRKLEGGSEDSEGPDSTDWYGLYGSCMPWRWRGRGHLRSKIAGCNH